MATALSQRVSQKGAEKVPRKPGRPKGTPKTGGRQKGVATRLGKEARSYLAQHGSSLETICKIAKGKRIRVAGPTGKQLWHTPTPHEVVEAAYWIAARLVPAMSATEVSGPDGEPLNPTRDIDDREFARMLAFTLAKGAQAADKAEADGEHA